MTTKQKEVIKFMNSLNGYIIVGIGNIVGWGDELIKQIKQYKVQ